MDAGAAFRFHGNCGVFATMHGKQRDIAPLMTQFLGLHIETAPRLNTDAFGTFSRDVDRRVTQHEAARAKIDAAVQIAPETPFRDNQSWPHLERAVQEVVWRCGAAWVESDMRALRNPRVG